MLLRPSHLSSYCLSSLTETWLRIFKWFVSVLITGDIPGLLALVEMSSCGCKKKEYTLVTH